MATTNQMKSIVNQLLKKHKIKVKKWSTSSCGRAYFQTRMVKIPNPTDVDRFCVCLHEIEHILHGKKGKSYEQEYACEMFAINTAKQHGFNVTGYQERARRYIIMCIAKAHCRGLNVGNIDHQIKHFCNINFNTWQGKKVHVSNWGTEVYKGKPLKISIMDK